MQASSEIFPTGHPAHTNLHVFESPHDVVLVVIVEMRCRATWSASRRRLAQKMAELCGSRPFNTATRSEKSQGRPRQPLPISTPAAPVYRIILSASHDSQISPLPKTGISMWFTSSPMASQSACPEYRSLAVRACRVTPTQPDSWAIRPLSKNVKCSSSMPLRNLIVTGMAPAAFTADSTIEANRRRSQE